MVAELSRAQFQAELSDFPSADLMQCPFPFYAEGRNDPAVFKLPSQDSYLVFRHGPVAEVFLDTTNFSTVFDHSQSTEFLEYGGATHILGTDAPDHRPKRELIMGSLSPGRLRAEEPKIREAVVRLIDEFPDPRRVEFVDQFAFPLPALVICRMLGLPSVGEQFELFRRWSRELIRISRAEGSTDTDLDVDNDVTSAVTQLVAQIVADRQASPKEDIISEILARQLERRGAKDHAQTTTFALEMLAGGVITTGQLIASCMLYIAKTPALEAELRAEGNKISAFIEEVLRVESPVQYRPRRAVRDVEIGGVKIPSGATVILMVGSANRDDRAFECPEEFRIGRLKARSHVAFGVGEHLCMGAPLARLEARVALEELLRRFKSIELMKPDEVIQNIDGRFFRAPAALDVVLEPV